MEQQAAYQLLFEKLYCRFGAQEWWPADTLVELCVGAVLTQNVSWLNVEKALANMQQCGLLNISRLSAVPREELAAAVRPAGYYNVKARRLKAFARHVVDEHDGAVAKLLNPQRPPAEVRRELLSIYGVGPETADSLLVYGAGQPAFIADAYGRRILARIGLLPHGMGYEEAREQVENRWDPQPPRDSPDETAENKAWTAGDLWGELHALLVRLGKEHCQKTNPECCGCPLLELCSHGQQELIL
jgi:endonuclease-3 related protein